MAVTALSATLLTTWPAVASAQPDTANSSTSASKPPTQDDPVTAPSSSGETWAPLPITIAGTVRTIAELPGGQTLLGGAFEQAPHARIYTAEGTPDPQFLLRASEVFDAPVNDTAVLPDGSILVAGEFDERVVTITANGEIRADAFPAARELSGGAVGVAPLVGGAVLVGGAFASPQPFVAVLNPQGELVAAPAAFDGAITDLDALADGQVAAVGEFNSPGKQSVLLAADGRLVEGQSPVNLAGTPGRAVAAAPLGVYRYDQREVPAPQPAEANTTERGPPVAANITPVASPGAQLPTPPPLSDVTALSASEGSALIAATRDDEGQTALWRWAESQAAPSESPSPEAADATPKAELAPDASTTDAAALNPNSPETAAPQITATDVPAEPTAPEPTAAEPTAPEPTAAEPTAAEAAEAEPAAAEPTAAEPAAPEPAAAEPTAAEPTAAEPTAAEPTAAEPTAAEPAAATHASGATAAPVTAASPTAPAAPTGLTATPGYQSATVTFTPGSDGGSVITGYEYQLDGGEWLPVQPPATTAPLTISGLSNGRLYEVAVRAVSAAGPGEATPSVPVMPLGAVFTPINPVRAYDSRADQPSGPIAGGQRRTLELAERAELPDDAVAVAYNLTVAGTQGSGYLSVASGDTTTAPATSTINWSGPGQLWANGFTTGVDAQGRLQVFAGGGATEFIVDVVGYYRPAPGAAVDSGTTSQGEKAAAATVFVPMDPARTFDSRTPSGGGELTNNTTRKVDMRAGGQVPDNALAVAYTLTQTGNRGTGYLTVGPADQPRPAVSSINWWASGQTTANSSVVAIAEGAANLYAGTSNRFSATHAVIDIIGYYVPLADAPRGGRFTPLTPSRAYDSRAPQAVGQPAGPIAGGQRFTTSMAVPGVPATATAVTFNLTETGTVGSGYLTTAPARVQSPPTASTINWWTSGQTLANGSVVALGAPVGPTAADQSLSVNTFAAGGATHYTLDVSGYFHDDGNLTVGRIDIPGPSGLTLSGTYRQLDANNWTVAFDSARGEVGGTQPGEVSGSMSSVNGVITADINVDLPDHPQVVPAWDQTAVLTITHRSAPPPGLVGVVEVTTANGPSSITMTGPLNADGTYALKARGSIEFAGATTALTGDYRSGQSPQDATWTIIGDGPGGTITSAEPGVTGGAVSGPAITMTQEQPGVTGTTTVTTDLIDIPANLDYVGPDSWRLTVDGGGQPGSVTPPQLPGLTVDSAQLAGTISADQGVVAWQLASPMTLGREELTFLGTVTLTGPQAGELEISEARGSVLGASGEVTLSDVSGNVTYSPAGVSGEIQMVSGDSLLVQLPDGWEHTTTFVVDFAPDGTSTIRVAQVQSNGGSRVELTGTVTSSDAFELVAGGQVAMNGTAIPVSGVYQSAGFVSEGVQRPAPFWSITGDIANAPNGRVPISGGSALTGGQLRMAGVVPGGGSAGVSSLAEGGDGEEEETQPIAFTGEVEFELGDGSTLVLTADVFIEDENNWEISLTSQYGEPWSPPGMDSLVVDLSTITGTVTSVDAVIDWSLQIAALTWENITSGVSLTTAFSISDACPLEDNCPEGIEGIFLGFLDGAMTFPDPVPDMSLNGALLTDGTWARFDAEVEDVVFNGIGFTDTAFTMWKGVREDSFEEGLEMPDLSSLNNGFNLEFCGNFQVKIPLITTLNTGGCTTWTPDGIVIGQLGMGGDIDSGEYNGISIGNTLLQGLGWTDLDFSPEVVLKGVSLPLAPNRYGLTADMTIPGTLMEALGKDPKDTVIPATGWFTETEFYLAGEVEVNMKSGGVTLESVSVEISREEDAFALALGADATASMGGNKYPMSAFIGVAAGGDGTEIEVRLDVQGSESADPNGGFDLATLLPSGDFEPNYVSTVDGDFDDTPQPSLLANGGFEDAVAPPNLIDNGDFEAGVGANLVPDGGFESGEAGNLLGNGDFEDDNALRNGDFDTGDLSGWAASANYTTTLNPSTTAPTEDEGTTAVTINNNYSSGQASNAGLYQDLAWAPIAGVKYELSAWVKSADGRNRSFSLWLNQTGSLGGTGCFPSGDGLTGQNFTATSSWTRVVLQVNGANCRTGMQAVLNPTEAGSKVTVDAVVLRVSGIDPGINPTVPGGIYSKLEIPNAQRGTTTAPKNSTGFDEMPPISIGTSDVYLTNDFGNPGNSLRTDGQGSYWQFNPGSWGSANGDFQMSYDIYFAGKNQDKSYLGFWLTGAANAPTGYLFHMASEKSKGGFYRVNNGNVSDIPGNVQFGGVAKERWHRVTLTAVGSQVRATVVRLEDSVTIYNQSLAMPSGNRSGVFGQVASNEGTGSGHRIDNFAVYSAPLVTQKVRYDPVNARSGNQFLGATGPSANWAVDFSSAEEPSAGAVYSLSGWVRSTGPNVTGNAVIRASGVASEVASVPFTATSQWTKFSSTLRVSRGDHSQLVAGLANMSTAGVEVQFDNLVLQQVPWQVSPTTPGALLNVVSTDGEGAREGLGAMQLTDRNNGSSAYIDLPPPAQGLYTASVWARSDSGVRGQLRLQASGSLTQTATAPVITTGQWTKYTVQLDSFYANQTRLRLLFDIDPGQTNRSVWIDDVEITASGVPIAQDPASSWGTGAATTFDQLPPISYAPDVRIDGALGNRAPSLRADGDGSWWLFNANSWGSANGDFDISYDVYYPNSRDRDVTEVGFWLTGSGTSANGYVFRTQNDKGDGGFYSVSSGRLTRVPGDSNARALASDVWHRVRLSTVGSTASVTVTRVDTGAVVHQHSVDLPGGNRVGVFGQINSGRGSVEGVRIDNFTVYKGTGAGQMPTVRDDPGIARSGKGYLVLGTTQSTSVSISRQAAVTPVVGNTYNATLYVRAPNGNVSGTLRFDTGLESGSTNFTATGDWTPVGVSLPISRAGSTGVKLTVDHRTGGKALLIDDVAVQLEGLTQPDMWQAIPDPGGVMPTSLQSGANAHSGQVFLKTSANGAAGTLRKDAAVATQPGENYTATAWVRAGFPGNVSGQLTLRSVDGTAVSRSTSFTATGTWQPVFVTLPITAAGTSALRTEIRVNTTGQTLLVDDVELRKVADWSPAGPAGVMVNEQVVTGSGRAASGPGYLWVTSSGAGGSVASTIPTFVGIGAKYTVRAYVRSTNGAAFPGELRLSATGSTTQTATTGFTATDSWQLVETVLVANAVNSELRPEVVLGASGGLDIDSISVTPDVIVPQYPWLTQVAPGGTVSAVVRDAPERAQGGSAGVMVMSTSGSGESGIYYDSKVKVPTGATYTGSVWVRSPSGAPVAGRLLVETYGGGPAKSAAAAFTADGQWQLVSLRLPISTGGQSGLRTSVLTSTPGVELDIDNAKVQQEIWTSFSDSGATAIQTQMNDPDRAESGSGYLRLGKVGEGEAGARLITQGQVSQGSSHTAMAYVRATNGSSATGVLRLVAQGGAAEDVASKAFTASAEWRKVQVTLPVTQSGQSALRTELLVDTPGVEIDFDSVTIGLEPLGRPDGVTQPLPHPERGYVYLWDNAFGIPGAHLWAITAQIQLVNGTPALGVGATMYFDPTKAPGLMTGTTWLKGDMTLNASTVEPCLSFGFDATGTDTRVQIDGGVFATSKFAINYAPRGCQVGDRVLDPGASFSLETELGNAPITLELAVARDENELPTFFGKVAVYDVVLAGTTYNTMELTVDITAEASNTTFVGDFTLPMGQFYGEFNLEVNADKLRMDGLVELTDWKLEAVDFNVSRFTYRQVVDVPFGAGTCATMTADTSGDMSMGRKSYAFVGALEVDCGVLKILHFEFDYMKNFVAYRFMIDYNADTRMLAGEIGFKFERKASWTYIGIKYKRHPKFQIFASFSMDVDNPSSAAFVLAGKVSVNGGSGSVTCSVNTDQDDGCELYVRINVFGGHTYRSNW